MGNVLAHRIDIPDTLLLIITYLLSKTFRKRNLAYFFPGKTQPSQSCLV